MPKQDWSRLAVAAHRLAQALVAAAGDHVPRVDARRRRRRSTSRCPTRSPDGRTGRVPAGCVFWMKADGAHVLDGRRRPRQLQRRQPHPRLQDARRGRRQLRRRRAARDRLGDDGRRPADPGRRRRSRAPSSTARWPRRRSTPTSCSCASTASSSWCCPTRFPDLRIEGKPQCHIVAIAKEQGDPAASVGCALSRVRTGMSVTEMTCAIPAAKLAEVVAVDRAQRRRRQRGRPLRRRRRPPLRLSHPSATLGFATRSKTRQSRDSRATSWRLRSRGSRRTRGR